MKDIIQVSDITKKYSNGTEALKEITFNLSSGIVGLIGANGAGKSTLMKILVTLLEPTTGEAYINGFNVSKDKNKVRGQIGYLPQEIKFYDKLTVEEILYYFSELKNIKDDNQVSELMERLNLIEYRNRKIGELSGGTKRRVGIAQALIGNPPILIIDEPTVGLDPEERVRLHEILEKYTTPERIIILSTHLIEDISKLCKYVVVLKEGNLMYAGYVKDKLKEMEGKVKIVSEKNSIKKENKNICILEEREDEGIKIVDELNAVKGKIVTPSLEDAYLYMMGGKK